MVLKLLLGTQKLKESIFKNSIAIIHIVLLFIVLQNVLTSNKLNIIGLIISTQIHGRDEVINKI